jgi:acyl-CoA synthetase (NDP forming)
MSPTAMDALFSPRSIAVLGASPDEGKPGGRCVAYLRRFGFEGEVLPINPRYEEIGGLPCYPDVDALPGPPDLLLVVIAAERVPAVVARAGELGTRAAVILSSGFGESGEEGLALERSLVEIAETYEMALLGPNCLGYVDLEAGTCATFSAALQLGVELQPGPIGFVSQSGAMGAAIFGLAQRGQIGLGLFASTGNEAALEFPAVLSHFAHDRRLTTLAGYMEGTRDGRSFVASAREAREAGKEVVLLKVGTTDVGRRAARSHTGAMAGAAEAWEAAFRRAGAIRAGGPEDLLDKSIALSCSPARPRGPRVGIVSMSGGAAVLMSDHAAQIGLTVSGLDAATKDRLGEFLPHFAAIDNPVDYGGIYGDPNAIAATVGAVADSGEVDMTIVFIGLSHGLAGKIESRLAEVARSSGKPLIAAWLGGLDESIAALRRSGVPAYSDPIRAVDAAGTLLEASLPLPADPPAPTLAPEVATEIAALGHGPISERAGKRLLSLVGVPIPAERLATDRAEAEAAAIEIGGRLAIKAEAADLVHKSDAGAVALDVAPTEAGAAFERVVLAARAAGATPTGALIAAMAPTGGLEMLVGCRWDPQFGPLVLVGAGGVTSESDPDVVVELAPVDRPTAVRMIRSLRLRARLDEFRGEPPRDVDALAEIVVAVGDLAAGAGPSLQELDLNPVTMYERGQGCLVLDAAAILEEK